MTTETAAFVPSYSPWRHGGWYVDTVRYPSGAVGCVSRNYADRKWRIACDERPGDHTYPSRDAAALAEYEIAQAEHANAHAYEPVPELWREDHRWRCVRCGRAEFSSIHPHKQDAS